MTGLWAYEADRALAAIEGLNLVITRPAAIYGLESSLRKSPGWPADPLSTGPGLVNAWCGRLLIGEIYKFTGDEMQMLWCGHVFSLFSNVHIAHTALSGPRSCESLQPTIPRFAAS